jgi:transposase-like protein
MEWALAFGEPISTDLIQGVIVFPSKEETMAKWIKRARAEQVIAEWEGLSGQEPLLDFCTRHGISPETFRRWRIRLAETTGVNPKKRPAPSKALKPAGPKPPRVAAPSSPQQPDFVELELPETMSDAADFAAEIRTARGSTIRIRSSIGDALLSRLLALC